ncbi:cutinase-domain-containing protein [Thozetella sp. PMI_491]|nr:cutinase-domain-containing protein [Thozetella sp. PMI_491]
MRAFLVIFLVIGRFLAATVAAGDSEITCASGLYMLCARGSGEPVFSPTGAFPNNTGSPGYLAVQVAKQVQGSIIAGVLYPATDPTNSANLTAYQESENAGAQAILDEVKLYQSSCPDSKIALIGYSQGAQAMRDAICGGSVDDFNTVSPLSPNLVKNNVVAIALIGDPTHLANEGGNRGTSTNDGIFSRKNTTICDEYDDFTASWCDTGDPYCDHGNSPTVHGSYIGTYGNDIVQFIVDKYGKSSSQNGSERTTSTTTITSASQTSTGAPTSTSSAKPNSATSLVLSLNALPGLATLLAVLSFC